MNMYEARQPKANVSKRIDDTGSGTRQKMHFKNAERFQHCNNVLNSKIQRFVTANATVYVETDKKKISEEASGTSGEKYEENNFTNFFLNNIGSKSISEIAKEDKWPDKLKGIKNGEMSKVRNSINCAEPHSVINALIKIKPQIDFETSEENIKSVDFKISQIMNDRNKPVRPCAVCRQWITNSNKGSGSGKFEDWIKAPLLNFTTKVEKRKRAIK